MSDKIKSERVKKLRGIVKAPPDFDYKKILEEERLKKHNPKQLTPNLLDKTTQWWVKASGRKIDPVNYSWLIGPIGNEDIIKDTFIESLMKRDKLEKIENPPHAGLLNSIADIGVTDEERTRLSPQIIHFYEHTSDYSFEVWSEWKGLFRLFGKLLSLLFSRRLQQLNLPLNSIDSSRGFNSKLIKLVHPTTKESKWTIWYRTLKSSNDVIYSGVYTNCQNPKYASPLIKVIFPLPNGNATVIMTKKVLDDGSLLLSSDGKKFGDHGFYFTLTDHPGKYWAKFVKPMHEWIHVYVDEENVLRTDHKLNFYGMRFLNLHYKMALS